jgi:hypothetical protein
MKKIICLCCLACATNSQAGSMWQLTDNNQPCAGQVIVGNTGDDNPGMILPAPDLNKEVISDTDFEPEVAPDHTYMSDDLDVETAEPASPYNR